MKDAKRTYFEASVSLTWIRVIRQNNLVFFYFIKQKFSSTAGKKKRE